MTRKLKITFAVLGLVVLSCLYKGRSALNNAGIPRLVVLSEDPAGDYGTPFHPKHDEGEPDSERGVREELQDESPVPVLVESSKRYDKYVIYEEKCRIRSYNHSDPSILKKYFSTNPTTCPKNARPFLFYPVVNSTLGHSCIGVDDAVLEKWYGGDVEAWSCTYEEAIRDLDKDVIDQSYVFTEPKAFNVGDCPTEEFIWIECTPKSSLTNRISRLLQALRPLPKALAPHQQPLMLPRVKAVRAAIIPNNIGRKPLHVAVFGLDSVSRLNAHRQFPKTMQFLKSKKNLIELFGYNKIGANSAPNQIPLLTGVPYGFGGLESRVGSNYFDNLTRYLWDHYEDRGYRTMYYEEQWYWGLFSNPPLRGFKKIPTTYWPRPIMQAIDASPLKKDGNKWCIGPDFPAKHYLDYTYNSMRILGNDRPLFSYSWLCETAHNDVDGGKRVDKYFHAFFTKMDNDGILDNTAVFFISDHGFRLGAFRETDLGRYEDMLPYGFVLMPDSYYEENPSALDNIRVNSRRLVTVYDLHATLLELADPWSEGGAMRTAHGYSLLSNKIPSDRSCEDAGINFQFCSCFEPQPVDSESDLSRSLAEFAIAEMNDVIKRNNAIAKCQEWSLDSVSDLVRLSQGNEWTDFYKATLRTKPPARFEITAQRTEPNQGWKLLSNIDRIDRFDTHAKCVRETSFQKYCYCK